MLLYVVFLGAVLPFICWGAWADPGHPHAGPHFVFADPPLAHGHAHDHAHQATPDQDAATTDAAAQARPSTTLVIASLVLLLSAALWMARPAASRRRHHAIVWALTYRPRTPTPPPRLSMWIPLAL